jgi:hypothetical protein
MYKRETTWSEDNLEGNWLSRDIGRIGLGNRALRLTLA